MNFDWTTGPLAEGLACYRSQKFWQAHEHWETLWLAAQEPDKTFIQALIQITAAFHHLQRNEISGALSLLQKALKRLESYPAEFGGVNVAELRQKIQDWLKALDAGAYTNLQIPPII